MTTTTSANASNNPGRKRIQRISRTAILYAVCIVLSLLFLFPVVWSMMTSLKPPAEALASPPTYLPSTITLENYFKLNQYGAGLFQYVYNSTMVAIGTVLGTIVLSTLGGYGFSRFDFPGKNVLFVIILATLMIPFQSILTPLFLILAKLRLQNTLTGLALVYITFQLPFGIFMMRNMFDTIPRELEEAALLDGCNTITLLYRVI